MRSKVIACMAVVLCMLGVCMGCGQKKEKSVEDFISFAEEKGFEVGDCTEQFAEYGYIEQAFVAVSPDGDYQIEFYEFDDDSGASAFYQENYGILSANEEQASSHSEFSAGSTQSYEITGSEGFGCVVRVGKTCFYAITDKAYANGVKSFKEEFGY